MVPTNYRAIRLTKIKTRCARSNLKMLEKVTIDQRLITRYGTVRHLEYHKTTMCPPEMNQSFWWSKLGITHSHTGWAGTLKRSFGRHRKNPVIKVKVQGLGITNKGTRLARRESEDSVSKDAWLIAQPVISSDCDITRCDIHESHIS